MPPSRQDNRLQEPSYAAGAIADETAVFDRNNDLDVLQVITAALTGLGTSTPYLRKKAEQIIAGIGAGTRTKKYVVSYIETMLKPYLKKEV